MSASKRETLFEEVCSQDFLSFSFGGRSYQDQLYDSVAKTKSLSGVDVEVVSLPNGVGGSIKVVWVAHNFGFLGGSLGCAEGEKITRAFEYACENNMSVVVQCRSGGARMQEGTSSLMQMAKVSVAVEKLRRQRLPFVSVLNDPTYGGVSASYAMQGDVRIALSNARIGFAGREVILNTMCDANQQKFDLECPADFQSASYVLEHGQIDLVLPVEDSAQDTQTKLEALVGLVCTHLTKGGGSNDGDAAATTTTTTAAADAYVAPTEAEMTTPFNYTKSRAIDRPQCQDIIAALFRSYVGLYGDGKVGKDVCMNGGLATFDGHACVVLGTFKGHNHKTMEEANYGMASPDGYRTALRLMQLAERFGLPVVTLVDTVGAWPTFACEANGQSEAIATNLTAMAALRVPIITVMVGEGGSGGALGVGMGNCIGMCSGGYFGVISPEGAASILGRYKDDAHKALQFPKDCQELATAQCIYANQLKSIGVVDEIIWETVGNDNDDQKETFEHFPVLQSRLRKFISDSLKTLSVMTASELVAHRYDKFRKMGTFSLLDEAARQTALATAEAKQGERKRPIKQDVSPSLLVTHLAEETVAGAASKYRKLAPSTCPEVPPAMPVVTPKARPENWTNAKKVLDAEGPDAVVAWVRAQKQVLVTDTTMRDAHQSLFATRARSEDLIKGAVVANELLKDAFSLEAWGGATFDVCMRFLDECPWERLRELRAACPDVCLQMLIRGANAVGYTSYADNVVAEFIRLAALNGMDVFRIFDCFNVVDNMKVAIDATRAAGKIAEVCICYTGNLNTSEIYNVDYYRSVAKEVADAGAHMIAIKDMAGLLRPLEVEPLLNAIRSVTDLPIHFHTHATAAGSIAVCIEMARCNCDIIDFATASMADGTSQPSLNVFVAMTEGGEKDTGINYLDLEPYDMYWARVREMYSPFESGMKSGSARVFEHQIPGGQYSNLYAQCSSMGIMDKWELVLDSYRDVNKVLGDVIKVTPSSKCVGDLALYLVTCGLTTADLEDEEKAASIDYPESVVALCSGDLGFPHRGFPPALERAILRGKPKRMIRAGLALPAVDFAANIATLSEEHKMAITPEQAMSSLMYPKVFSDYMKRRASRGRLLRYLPTPVYFHAMTPGQKFTMSVPVDLAEDALKIKTVSETEAGFVNVTVECLRVSSLKDSHRLVTFSVNGQEQHHNVKDTGGKFVFEGAMADTTDATQVGAPMPGVIEKILVSDKQTVAAGDVLCVVSAMKMEVKVTAATAGVVTLVQKLGARIVEGALLATIKPL